MSIVYFGSVTLDVTSGPLAGGTDVVATDSGNGFIGVCTGTINGVPVTDVVVSDDQHMQFKTPAGAFYGPHYVVEFQNEDGETVVAVDTFQYLPSGDLVFLPISTGDGTYFTVVNNKGSTVKVFGDYSGTPNLINGSQEVDLTTGKSVTVSATTANNWSKTAVV